MATHDIGAWAGTHGGEVANAAWRNPSDGASWWSPFPSSAAASVGIALLSSFLGHFKSRRWRIILPGRAAVLRLRGRSGVLDVVVVLGQGSTSSRRMWGPLDLRVLDAPRVSESCAISFVG
eukprot:5882916-Pyramimonas_sp.AAC.1